MDFIVMFVLTLSKTRQPGLDMFSGAQWRLSYVYEWGSLPGDQASPQTHKERMSDQRGQRNGCSDG